MTRLLCSDCPDRRSCRDDPALSCEYVKAIPRDTPTIAMWSTVAPVTVSHTQIRDATEKLLDRATVYAVAHGYTVEHAETDTVTTHGSDGTAGVKIILTATLRPILDGVWGQIRWAMAEAIHDREYNVDTDGTVG